MGSTRLPGKVLLPLNGHTVIGEVLTRCGRIPGVDKVVCAIPDTKENDELAHEAGDYCSVYRGPEFDVLARYHQAAIKYGADIIVRVTGDCPLISPDICGQVVTALKEDDCDYSSNVEPRTFPQGYDCEAFTIGALRAADYAAGQLEREHVTTWMRDGNCDTVNVESPYPLDGRLVLDTEDDYKVICAAFGHEPYQRLQAA